MLYICEDCGRCDELDLPRDIDRARPCCDGSACTPRDWRADAKVDPPHITEQLWIPEVREDGVYLIGADDRSVVLKMGRPDHGSDLMMAGYIVGLQARQRRNPP
jgi:hypothetical protein